MRIHIDGMRGLGDNIYQLGFVHALADQGHQVTVVTPWPELYKNVPDIQFHRIHTTLRTQAKNMKRVPVELWSTETSFDKRLKIHYGAGVNIPDDFKKLFGVDPVWKFPKFKGLKLVKPYIVVRPSTLRKEWFAASRNPKAGYINQVIDWLKSDYQIISVADFEDGQEWPDDVLPYADVKYHKGELSMTELMGLCQGAAGIVGGVGWIVPFAAVSNIPAFIICGGNGGYNHPDKLVNDTMNFDRLHFIKPDKYCMCIDMTHDCNKEISDLRGGFDDWQRLL